MDKIKQKAIDDARALLDKKFGKGTTFIGNERLEVPVICSSGSFKLDGAIGIGGIPRGRIIEIYGPEASGKTTTALHIIREAQKVGETCAFVDAEHALDPVWAGNIGVKMDELIMSQPNSGEEGLEITEALVRSGAVGIIVVDSVAALVPKAEIEGEMGDSHMGLQARLMSQAMRKLTPVIAKSNCTVIFINQLRDKIGVMFGSPETTTGGNALKFYSTIRMDVRRQLGADSGTERNDEDGLTTAAITVKIVKNKVAPPFKKVSLKIMADKENNLYGYDVYSETVDMAIELGFIEKGGTWYEFIFNPNEKPIEKLQGKKKVREYFLNNPDYYKQLQTVIEAKIKEENAPIIGSFNEVTTNNSNDEPVTKKRRTKKKEDTGEENIE